MAKKPKRQNIMLDMTAMCDMAFLLLTFFMLATRMKNPEPITVETPYSTSDIKLDDKDTLTKYVILTLGKEGQVYFGIPNKTFKDQVYTYINDVFDLQLTESELKSFKAMETFGMPMGEIKDFMSRVNKEKGLYESQPGIPVQDTTENNELVKWLNTIVYEIDNTAVIAIRGDEGTPYKKYKHLVNILQSQTLNLNKFTLITVLESKENSAGDKR